MARRAPADRARRRVRRGALPNARHANVYSAPRADRDRNPRPSANACATASGDYRANSDPRARADRGAYPRPDSGASVRPPRNYPRASCANAYGDPRAHSAVSPAADRNAYARASAHGDPNPRAHGDAHPAANRNAYVRAGRRMARRRPHRSERRRPRRRRNPHARRRLVRDDRGSRRRQIRSPLLLRHLVTELPRRVSDAQWPLRRLQRRRRNRRSRMARVGQRAIARRVRPPAQP